MPAKRSNPEYLTPPNGSDCDMYVEAKSLMLDMPVLSLAAIRRARLLLPQKTLDPSPKSLSFANSIASSSVLNDTTDMTGPKTSSCQMRIESVTPVRMVGG